MSRYSSDEDDDSSDEEVTESKVPFTGGRKGAYEDVVKVFSLNNGVHRDIITLLEGMDERTRDSINLRLFVVAYLTLLEVGMGIGQISKEHVSKYTHMLQESNAGANDEKIHRSILRYCIYIRTLLDG